MADFTLEINENMVYGILDDQVVGGLKDLAESVAITAKELAPVGKRTRTKPRDLRLEYRKVKNLPVGTHDYIRPQLGGEPYELDEDVHQYIMSELGKRESGLYDVTATVPSLNRRGKVTDYPLMNARAITKAGPAKKVRQPLSGRVIEEPQSVPTKLVTGKRLKDSIIVMMSNEGEATWVAEVIADRPYAYYVEKGLGPGQSKREPAYFMERALAAHAAIIESGDILKR